MFQVMEHVGVVQLVGRALPLFIINQPLFPFPHYRIHPQIL
jgi:hypothetical protein